MAHPPKADSKRLQQEQRKARLAAELRSNLLKRKAQARSRGPQQDASGIDLEADGQEQQPGAQEAANAHRKGPTGEVA